MSPVICYFSEHLYPLCVSWICLIIEHYKCPFPAFSTFSATGPLCIHFVIIFYFDSLPWVPILMLALSFCVSLPPVSFHVFAHLWVHGTVILLLGMTCFIKVFTAFGIYFPWLLHFQTSNCPKNLRLTAPCHIVHKWCYYSNQCLLPSEGDALSTTAAQPPAATKTKHGEEGFKFHLSD